MSASPEVVLEAADAQSLADSKVSSVYVEKPTFWDGVRDLIDRIASAQPYNDDEMN